MYLQVNRLIVIILEWIIRLFISPGMMQLPFVSGLVKGCLLKLSGNMPVEED